MMVVALPHSSQRPIKGPEFGVGIASRQSDRDCLVIESGGCSFGVTFYLPEKATNNFPGQFLLEQSSFVNPGGFFLNFAPGQTAHAPRTRQFFKVAGFVDEVFPCHLYNFKVSNTVCSA